MIRKIMQMKEGNIHHDRIIVIVALFVWIACISFLV